MHSEENKADHNANLAALTAALSSRPRVPLATLPTPLHHLPRFSDWSGRDVWVKRDDLTGLAFGGNKARKLEFILGAGVAEGFDTLVTVGAAQSNHARSVAAAARIVGWDCHLILGGPRPGTPSGNLALDVALGAHIHFAGSHDWNEFERQAAVLVGALTRRGRHPLLLPMGGSTPAGALGFVQGYFELLDQCTANGLTPDSVVVASSTGGTQAGLAYARAVLGAGPEIIGVGVAKRPTDIAGEVSRLVQEIAELLDVPAARRLSPTVLGGYLGAGYAQPSQGATEAAAQLLRTEAVFTDPVYSAKALHAIVDLTRVRSSEGPIVFWHTGGTPALFADSVGITGWPEDR